MKRAARAAHQARGEVVGNDDDEERARTRSRSSSGASSSSVSQSQSSLCIICIHERAPITREYTTWRICEYGSSQKLLDAASFNDDEVSTRCSFLSTPDHVFAADVMYHPSCMRGYIRKYEKKLEVLARHVDSCNLKAKVDEHCSSVFQSLDFKTTGYSVSYIRDQINEALKDDASSSRSNFKYENKRVKVLLLKHFGSEICFTYPSDRKLSQMVYSNMFNKSWKVVEVLRYEQHTKIKQL